MPEEKKELKDSISIRLYGPNGQLKEQITTQEKDFLTKLLEKLMEILRNW